MTVAEQILRKLLTYDAGYVKLVADHLIVDVSVELDEQEESEVRELLGLGVDD